MLTCRSFEHCSKPVTFGRQTSLQVSNLIRASNRATDVNSLWSPTYRSPAIPKIGVTSLTLQLYTSIPVRKCKSETKEMSVSCQPAPLLSRKADMPINCISAEYSLRHGPVKTKHAPRALSLLSRKYPFLLVICRKLTPALKLRLVLVAK